MVVLYFLTAYAMQAASGDAAMGPIVVDEQGRVLRDGRPYRGIGFNYFSAFNRRLADPNDTSYREGFAELEKRGIPFVRFAACGFWPVDMRLYVDDKEAYLTLLDDVVRAAEEHHVGLIPSLFWYNACVPDLVGEPLNQWGNPDSKTIAFLRTYTSDVVGRYLDSPAIWAWELGNEYSLAVDLPNAAEQRPWIVPDRGTPDSRSGDDDLRHDMMMVALREFGAAVRAIDPDRPITTGHSLPRPSAHHQRTELSWTGDTRDEFSRNLMDVTPDPFDLVSVHMYPHDHANRYEQPYTSYDELIALSLDAVHEVHEVHNVHKVHKALFIGEFGARDDEEGGGRDAARREGLALLTAIERSDVPLAALWVFDLSHQDSFINVTPTNHRSYLLDAVAAANRRIQLEASSGTHRVSLEGAGFSGDLVDNALNAGRSGSGFNPLMHQSYPGRNLFRDEMVGLNFEHVFSGMADDKAISMFTPRKDVCTISRESPASATLHWPAAESSWAMDCAMRYTVSTPNCVDMTFTATPTENRFGLGYAAMMWASYMNHTRGRCIRFYGKDGDREGWVVFGEDTADGFETGTIRYDGVEPLPYEEDAQTLNIIEHPAKTFLLPFYYGLVDGDGDPDTTDDTMAYVMMFDQHEPIRFAMWNFNRNAAGDPDTHSPAWDWQFVIRDPEPGRRYGYRARVLYTPFTTPDAIKQAYLDWADSL